MKSVEEVGCMPCMVGLDAFAQKLSPELRVELYRQVECFLLIGYGHGVMTGASGVFGGKSIETEQEVFVAYLQKKAQECR